MTYPKARITRSRSRSRNMRKKHLVKSKRNNRSRKSKKTHSRKYRGGDAAVRVENIEAIIRAGKAKTFEQGTDFPKVSYHFNPTEKIHTFLQHSNPGDPPTMLGTSSGGAREHFLYHSNNNNIFLVYNMPGIKETNVYYLEEWMITDIKKKQEIEERTAFGPVYRERTLDEIRNRRQDY